MGSAYAATVQTTESVCRFAKGRELSRCDPGAGIAGTGRVGNGQRRSGFCSEPQRPETWAARRPTRPRGRALTLGLPTATATWENACVLGKSASSQGADPVSACSTCRARSALRVLLAARRARRCDGPSSHSRTRATEWARNSPQATQRDFMMCWAMKDLLLT